MQKYILKLLDWLSGNQIKKNLDDIKKINAIGDITKVQIYQERKISDLLSIAKSHTSFYSSYSKYKNFTDYPIINKNTINSQRSAFINNSYPASKLKKVTTSGSTGVPFLVYHNKEKIYRQIADNYYFSELCGHLLGQKLYYIRIWNEINNLGIFQRFLKNIVQINTASMDEKMVKNLLNILNRNSSMKSILAYASSLDAITEIVKSNHIESLKIKNLSCVITMAESLSKDSKLFIENLLNTKVYSRYSNSENGFFAHQIPSLGDSYKINQASFKIEVLDIDSDNLLTMGKVGRIVITDFFNYAMPMIRYDTGDIGVMDYIYDDKGCQHLVLTKIEGRKLDFINIDGKFISPHTVDYALRSFEYLKQFQLIVKKDKTFQLLLNTSKTIESQDEIIIIERLKNYLGENVEISIKLVDNIPLLTSGKRKIVQIEN